MPAKNEDLHGSAPDKCETALLLIDVINDLEFPEAEQIVDTAVAMARNIERLKERARKAGVPIIYVNDNFGKWKSDWRRTVEHCLEEDVRGRPLVEILKPGDDDYFVLKPKHSAFFETTLNTLLRYLHVRHLVLTGITADMCLLLTASDAYMRDYRIHVARDCTASIREADNRQALDYMARVLKANVIDSNELDLLALKDPAD